MAENSGISWTTHTFNPWLGCTKVSPACKFCYAERDMDHRYGRVAWGPMGTRVVTSPANWKKPLKWNREAEAAGVRYRVFCASLADVFEDWRQCMYDHRGGTLWERNGNRFSTADEADRPGDRMVTMADVRESLFALIDATPHLDWLLLTKRPENIRRMYVPHCTETVGGHVSQNEGDGRVIRMRPNVWLGTSTENQEQADKRIPELLKCHDLAPVLFLSCEPLLGFVDLTRVSHYGRHLDVINGRDYGIITRDVKPCASVDWVIAGGESGPNARPSHPTWYRSLRGQCNAGDVPFHFKQFGEYAPSQNFDAEEMCDMRIDLYGRDVTGLNGQWDESDACLDRVGVKKAGRLLDGVLHDAFPVVFA